MTCRKGIQLSSVISCEKCGLYPYHKEKCCAEKARCHKCNRIGHFARVCLRPAVRQKSVLSKQRDQERMTAFIRRKTAECTLAFYNEEDAFFQKNTTNNAVSQVSIAEFKKSKSTTESLIKTIKGIESENTALVLKNQRLKNFNEQLQNEVYLKKSEISNLRERSACEIKSLKETLTAESSKLKKMDRIIEDFKKLNDDYEKLRIKYNQRGHEAVMMESAKNDQIDDLKTEIKCLKSEISQNKERTKYLCRKRGNQNSNLHHNLSNAREGEFPHEWRGGKSYHGRQQGQIGRCNRNGRY